MYQLPSIPSFDDVERLVQFSVRESTILEFKQTAYSNTDAGRKELLFDVASLSNASGGHLIIGVEERDNVPVATPGIADGPLERDRMVSSILSAIEPRISGLDVRLLEKAGMAVIVAFVPRSSYGPHMVTFQQVNKFWKRVGTARHPMSTAEIREHCLRTEMLRSRLDDFLRYRWTVAASDLQPRGFVVSVTPVSLEERAVDVSDTQVRQRLVRLEMPKDVGEAERWPLGDIRPSLDGVENSFGADAGGTFRLFRNGHIEFIYKCGGDDLEQRRALGLGEAERRPCFRPLVLMTKIVGLMRLAKSIHDQANIVSPVIAQISILNAVGTACASVYEPYEFRFVREYRGPEQHIRIQIQYDHDWSPGPVAKEVADRVWNAYHFENCPLLTAEGVQVTRGR